MKPLVISILLFLACGNCFAQDDTLSTKKADNAIYIELLGSGIIYSVNYERHFSGNLFLRVGAGYTFNIDAFLSDIWSVPISTGHLITIDSDTNVELGIANTFLWHDNEMRLLPGPIAGIRKQMFDKGSAFVRVTFTPLFDIDKKLTIVPLGGISLGFRF